MQKIIYGGKIITEDRVLENKALIYDEKIINIVDTSHVDGFEGEKIEFRGYISPGFIDIHIHGCAGYDVMDGTQEALEAISKNIIKSGTTAFLATTMTMEQQKIDDALTTTRNFMQAQSTKAPTGAQVLGVHLEGPFINPAFKGAQNAQYIQKPTTTWVEPYLDIIKIITLAPEMDDDFKTIRELKDKTIISIGHSGADYDCACGAYDAGATNITHCFNAMSGLNHRNPGVVGAALIKPFNVELITDFVHFHPDLLTPVLKLKGVDKCILITDAMRACMLEDGEYELGGQPVTLKDGAAKLHDGTIAGSVHRQDKALVNVKEHTDLDISRVIQMLSLNPARLLKVDDKKGSIAVGKDADIVLLNTDLSISEVVIGGVSLWK